MATVNIDGKEYNLDELSETAKELLNSLKFAQTEIQRTQAKLALFNTAASLYSSKLKSELDQ